MVIDGGRQPWFARPEDLDGASRLPAPRGTTLICPFDSLLWQRSRAEDLLRFRYRVELYVPPEKREFGYYVMPILHDGKLVGRLDPEFHRDRRELEIRSSAWSRGSTAGAISTPDSPRAFTTWRRSWVRSGSRCRDRGGA